MDGRNPGKAVVVNTILTSGVFNNAEMTPQEQVYLLMLLNIWDTNGKGLTFPQVLRALEIGNVKRSHIPQLADPERDGRRNGKEYSMLSENNIASVNRVDTIALESEIMESRKREDALRMQVNQTNLKSFLQNHICQENRCL